MVGSIATGESARQIARAAARLFATRGYEATSVREIVEAAGVTKPTLYYHFGSKEGLAQALVTDPLSAFVAAMRGRLATGADPIGAMAGLLDAHFEFMKADPDRGRFFYGLYFGPHDSTLSAELARFGTQIEDLFRSGVAGLAEAGLIDPDRAGGFATACHGAVLIQTMDFLYEKPGCVAGPRAEYGPDLARAIVTDLIRGYGPSPSGRPRLRADR